MRTRREILTIGSIILDASFINKQNKNAISRLPYLCNTLYLLYSKLYWYQADVQDTLSPKYVNKCTLYLGISNVASPKETCALLIRWSEEWHIWFCLLVG